MCNHSFFVFQLLWDVSLCYIFLNFKGPFAISINDWTFFFVKVQLNNLIPLFSFSYYFFISPHLNPKFFSPLAMLASLCIVVALWHCYLMMASTHDVVILCHLHPMPTTSIHLPTSIMPLPKWRWMMMQWQRGSRAPISMTHNGLG